VESVEPAGIGNELWPLSLEHLPNRLVRKLGVLVGLGVGDASIKQPGVQLIEVLEPQPRREEPLTHQPDLVLDLPLLPARRRRAGNWLDQVMAAHLQEAASRWLPRFLEPEVGMLVVETIAKIRRAFLSRASPSKRSAGSWA
jgi:hypothetical protein